MYCRMCIPAILGDISDTVLYLDTDVLCLGDISELFTVNLDRKLLAAVPETTLYRAYINKLNVFVFRSTDPYFNSGVLLFNNKYWNESSAYTILSEKIRQVELSGMMVISIKSPISTYPSRIRIRDTNKLQNAYLNKAIKNKPGYIIEHIC
ncbi:Glycosyl transferase family 8 [Neisseria subflava]|nr:Glycosyl transferase family 8 [Neisseria subflava]